MASVFATLNRLIGALDSEPFNNDEWGFQVLSSQTPLLDPYFDFLTTLNARRITDGSIPPFLAEISTTASRTGGVNLGVYSTKTHRTRDLYLPFDGDGKLNLTLQWCPLGVVEKSTWHVLDIAPNSPAEKAELLPYSDYIIGSPEGLLFGEASLANLVEGFLERECRFWVYNFEFDVVRLVRITPSRGWGGEGALGCMLGFGALHRIPTPLEEGPVQEEGEMLFDVNGRGGSVYEAGVGDAAQKQVEMVSAAQTQRQMAVTAQTKGGKKQSKATAGLDEYFKEGEEKSRQIDRPSSAKPADLPPPPKRKTKGEDEE
ncbi:hypothetical protein K470DRAFT_267126 [Piedraia hortae CBS 480.64]|uniref:PDZ GRASP-type domain-containing protein n=1 Tax=Piedraia hortae CBS 480.64 TaxID=1314780 RepID=A0A6A7C9L9_9PEZI|nr:hypothetical protein K470DRAFT_267126 [Piedraia hortae CBS 480.64]